MSHTEAEGPSFDCVLALFGRHGVSPLAEAVRESVDEAPTGESVLTMLGGPHTSSILGCAVRECLPAPEVKSNLTSAWLGKNGREVRRMLVEHLTHKLQTSRRISVIEDHVQAFLLRLVERDTLRPVLAEGKEPQASVLRIWAYQSACTELRGWGVDAALRTSRGAKTNRDRLAESGKLPTVVVTSEEAAIERRYEVENGEVVSDIYDPHARSAEDEMVSAETMERARSLVLRKIAGAGPRYAALFDALVDGSKRADLASEAGVSRNRMASMLARIREVLRDEDSLFT